MVLKIIVYRLKHIICGVLLVFMATWGLSAQQPLSSKFYQLQWDNDVFMMTDYYYTQGMSFTSYHPFFDRNPVNLILLKPKGYVEVINGISIFQRTYTPKDIKSDEIQYADRPYAGVLVLTSHSRAVNRNSGWMYHSELDLGVMGPASGAGQVQYKYHDLTENQLPNGWQYQQYNWPIVNYNLKVYKEVYQSRGLGLYALGKARIGTLHDDASVGALFRLGKMDDYYESLGLPLLNSGSQWQLFFESEPAITAVAYNGTMMGGWHRNPKIHYIEFDEMSKLIGTWRSGIGAHFRSFGLSFDVYLQSKEFKSGSHHWYTSTKLFLNF